MSRFSGQCGAIIDMQVEGFSQLELIYKGHHNYIYKATRDQDKRTVALKSPIASFPEPRQLAALKREHHILQALDGRGIPLTFDCVEIKNSAYSVREWIDGMSLRDYFSNFDIPLNKALYISIEIVRLIGLLHRQSFCHRDISPGNVIINIETNTVTLVDFCFALEFPNRARHVIKPKFVEGSRAYMSPEQTGRMNRGLDFRTDFYSFGVLLYELFTGRLPFTTKDNNELIHSHIALEPVAPHLVSTDIPQMLSTIILKLMSKSPDLRYQSAQGIQADLERCLAEYQHSNCIGNFELATHDLPDWFIIPDKRYGRDKETAALVNAFEQTSNRNGHLVFVTGCSGIGKTSLIKELYRPLVDKGGYISSGKYDQVLRHQPYSAILQALTGVIMQIIAEEQASKEFWKGKILEGIGNNGQILIEVIPELEYLIGTQSPVSDLSMEAASTRFNTTFHNLLHTLGHSGVPLVLFIDDLQWIDPPSLALLEAMAPTLADSTLLIISAYRNNEVSDTHPLLLAMPSLKASCKNIATIELGDLPLSTLFELLQDTLNLPESELHQLNQLLFERTRGNPLIYRTMLFTLYSQNSIFYDYDAKRWNWNKKAVEAMPQAENSLEMLQFNMQRLPNETSNLLKLAGCVGNTFSLELLASLSKAPKESVAKSIIPAVAKGFIQPLDDDFELYASESGDRLPDISFRFSHDRVQQSAYSQVSSSEQVNLHWQIGQNLLEQMTQSQSEALLFDAVEHLNEGAIHAEP